MPNPHTYLQYNDPLSIISRAGTADDPFVDKADSLPIINGIITLLEIPSKTAGVQIDSMVEIDQELYDRRPYLNANEFLVDYAVGIIQFHPSLEGTTKLCRYKGRGLIMYPASRIYAMISRSPDVIQTLQDYIDEMDSKINENQLMIGQIHDLLEQTRKAMDNTVLATDNANSAAETAQDAAALALNAYQTTRLVFLPPVEKFQDVMNTYPAPSVGMTIQTYSDGKRFRYDGSSWVEIDVFGSNLQVVNANKDGLMSVADFLKLQSYPNDLRDRVVCFSLPDAVQGLSDNFVVFPFPGQIVSMRGYCQTAGETPSLVSLERSRDALNWTEVTKDRLAFSSKQNTDDQSVTFTNTAVESGDMFRVNIVQQGFSFYNLTVILKIRT